MEAKSQETIAAIATAPGRGGVAVVRISGPDAFQVASKATGCNVGPTMAGTFRFVSIGTVDRGLMLVFAAPSSYTGENVVELQVHGGSVVPKMVLEHVLGCGARLARRGEFTERAFLNGKLDLSEAEAVIDMVDAKNARAAEDANRRLSGELSRRFDSLYGSLLQVSSELEHSLDFSEDELPGDFFVKRAREAESVSREIASLLSSANEGRILRNGALVVLCGKPNAGKSSLMNALLGTDRAIVSDIAGTTRDSIEESLDIGGWPIRLVDTAGLRDSEDAIESEGVRRSNRLIGEADMVLELVAPGESVSGEDGRLFVGTKRDLTDEDRGDCDITVSARTGYGLDGLRKIVVRELERMSAKSGEASEPDITARQFDYLAKAGDAVTVATGALREGEIVIAANALRNASEAVAEMLGCVYGEDLLNNLFSRFCVGK